MKLLHFQRGRAHRRPLRIPSSISIKALLIINDSEIIVISDVTFYQEPSIRIRCVHDLSGIFKSEHCHKIAQNDDVNTGCVFIKNAHGIINLMDGICMRLMLFYLIKSSLFIFRRRLF